MAKLEGKPCPDWLPGSTHDQQDKQIQEAHQIAEYTEIPTSQRIDTPFSDNFKRLEKLCENTVGRIEGDYGKYRPNLRKTNHLTFSTIIAVASRGGGGPGDTISRGDTKRKKLINFMGKMVKINKL